MKRLSAILLLITLTVSPALGWNHTGHMIVSELTWRELSPSKREAISNLLKQHPHYALLLATNVPPGVDTNEWVFLRASLWPDMVRPSRSGGQEKPADITKYHRSQWHYINIPYVLPADAGHISPTNFTIPTTNILWALTNALTILEDPHAAPPDKAVSLCWLLHLVGDLHQPLHAATLLSDAYPQGDQGGNALAIVDASQTPMNLHSFWDQLLDTGDSYEFVASVADNIAHASQYDSRNLREYGAHKTIRSWADESFAAAVTFAYAEGNLKFADWKAYSAGKIPAADIPHLKSTYILNANDLARRRVSLAGRRMADLLNKLYPP